MHGLTHITSISVLLTVGFINLRFICLSWTIFLCFYFLLLTLITPHAEKQSPLMTPTILEYTWYNIILIIAYCFLTLPYLTFRFGIQLCVLQIIRDTMKATMKLWKLIEASIILHNHSSSTSRSRGYREAYSLCNKDYEQDNIAIWPHTGRSVACY